MRWDGWRSGKPPRKYIIYRSLHSFEPNYWKKHFTIIVVVTVIFKDHYDWHPLVHWRVCRGAFSVKKNMSYFFLNDESDRFKTNHWKLLCWDGIHLQIHQKHLCISSKCIHVHRTCAAAQSILTFYIIPSLSMIFMCVYQHKLRNTTSFNLLQDISERMRF